MALRYDAEYVRAKLSDHAEWEGGQRALARKIGCKVQLLNNIIRGVTLPCGKPLEYLRLRKRVFYEPF